MAIPEEACRLVVESKALTTFRKRVLLCCSAVEKGKVTTYKAIADALDSSSRSVGQALKSNPFAPMVPCHRVVRTDLTIGGFAGATALDSAKIRKKIGMLRDEGVYFGDDGRMGDTCRARCVQRAFPDVDAVLAARCWRKRSRAVSAAAAPASKARPRAPAGAPALALVAAAV